MTLPLKKAKRGNESRHTQKEVAYTVYVTLYVIPLSSVSVPVLTSSIFCLVENKAQHEATKIALQAAISLCELTYFELFSLWVDLYAFFPKTTVPISNTNPATDATDARGSHQGECVCRWFTPGLFLLVSAEENKEENPAWSSLQTNPRRNLYNISILSTLTDGYAMGIEFKIWCFI